MKTHEQKKMSISLPNERIAIEKSVINEQGGRKEGLRYQRHIKIESLDRDHG